MPIVYILTLILLATASQQCAPSLYSLNLTTDIITLSPDNLQNNAYNYTFRLSFNSVPQVALAIAQLATTTPDSLKNSYFYISSQRTTTQGTQMVLSTLKSSWMVSRICLWASTNTHMLLGSAAIQNLKPMTGGASISLQFQISISSTLPVNSNQIARGFLNGLTCRGQLSSITIASTAFAQGKIMMNLKLDAQVVDVVWVSFIVFNLYNGEFAAYGDYANIASNSAETIDLLKGFSSVQNVLYGVNALQADESLSGLNVQMAVDSNFLLSYTSKMGSFVATYLFVGFPANFVCNGCKTSDMNYFLNGSCVNSCSGNTVAVTLSNGGKLCRPCPAGTGLIAINGNCVCPPAYTMLRGKCTSTSPDSLSTLSVQSSAPLAIRPTSTQSAEQTSGQILSGGANILPDGNINQNLDFTSSPIYNAVSSTPVFLPPTTTQPPQTTSQGQSIIKTYQITNTVTSSFTITCPLPNTFYNGNECVCNVGYVFTSGKCLPPQNTSIINPISPIFYPIPSIINKTQTCQANAVFNGTACVCIANFHLINNNCMQCPANSQWTGSTCVCNLGYTLSNSACILKMSCPANSQDNGLGICICSNGYTMVNNTCQAVRPSCPPFSTLVNKACVCNTGYFNISGTCSQCPVGSFWSAQSRKCIFVCGINSVYNQTVSGCVCAPGFGKDGTGNCIICPNNFYLFNGYCITCPNNGVYNLITQKCQCLSGFLVSQQGICMQKCGANQVYNPATTYCDCAANYSRVGSACLPCSVNSYYFNGQCVSCPVNSFLVGKRCVCNSGFAADSYGVCQACSSLPNAFMMNGFCVTCSSNLIYNSTTGICQCAFGKTWSGGSCVSTCNNDELLDRQGNCYTCGINEVISQGVCTCRSGFARNVCGVCTINCGNSSFPFMGGCGVCPMSMNYLPQIGGCVCPNGYYMDPITNNCAVSPSFVVPSCANGSYYDNRTQKCTACGASCTSCAFANTCLSCANGYVLNGGICLSFCGDGIIVGSETCDSNVPQPGCINCQVTAGYSCVGQPSVCSPKQTNNTTPNTTNPSIPRLALKGNISLNSNNIFLTLITTPTFTFPNPNAMQNFMQATYINTLRPSTYCVQQPSPNLNCFDCLLIYPSGIPNTKFNVLFYFNYQGQAANVTVTIDPLLYATTSRTVQQVTTRPS